MARKKSKAAASVKKSKSRRSGGSGGNGEGSSTTQSKPTVFEKKMQYAGYAVMVAILGILALFFVVSSSSSSSSSSSLLTSSTSSTATASTSSTTSSKKNQSSEVIQKNGKNENKEAFLKWFIDNGGIFHPISIPSSSSSSSSSSSTGNNDRKISVVNVTIEEFPSYGGWGLALPIPILPPELELESSSSESPESSSCQSETTDGQCTDTSSVVAAPSAPAAISEDKQTPASITIIKHLDPLFNIPSTLIISIESIIDTYALSSSSPLHLLNQILTSRGSELFPHEHHHGQAMGLARRGMGLVQQDIVIGLHLMVEECYYLHADLFKNGNDDDENDDNNDDDDDQDDDDDRGSSSRVSQWGPYLDILPQYTIPRLDTFDDEEYAALKDEKLEYTGRNSRRVLERLYYSNDDDGGGASSGSSGSSGPSLKTVVQAMIRQKNGPTLSPLDIPESCLRFETFHRFVGIVSSRAMVLKGVKYLTPLAEMINYSPKVVTTTAQQQQNEKKKSKDHIRAPFDLYHSLSSDNSITVRSDRDVILDENTASTTATSAIQLFEDYGPVDSSLFLEAHGFVPHENPNNCAMISGSSFLRRKSAVGRHDENVSLVLQALKALHLIHPEVQVRELDGMLLEDVCVKSDLGMVDDGNTVGRRPASDSIAITSLVLGNSHVNSNNSNSVWNRIENKYGETFVSLREKCVAAIRSGDTERMEIRCARYPRSGAAVKDALRTAATRSKFEDGDTEEKLLLQLQHAELEGRDRLAVALRFRIEERKILSQVANSANEGDDENGDIITEQMEVESSESADNLEAKLIAFNSFVESLKLPLNKIEPKLVGGGMRIGTCATEDLEVGDAYISLPANSVIDVTTALVGVVDDESSSDFASLLRKYSELNTPYNDGFDTLLLYLLHERFLLKEQSRWWPYLDLLPSIEELTAFHPLFFKEEEMNRYLAGSDVRGFILRYQQRAAERHAALSSDLDANLVLGSDVLLDKEKVYWATAIIDSRSIWWGGKRHVSPLLDLVNADSQGDAHETKLEDSEDVNQKLAVTRASRRVGKGEQVFENYAQANYLLFAYHGFLLEDNANDCALLDGLFIRRNDPGAKSAHLLRSRTPTFCIRDLASIEELAHFLRIKHGLSAENSSGSNLDDDVRPLLIEVLEGRVARLMEATSNGVNKETFALPRVHFMKQMVKNDLMHFQHALKTHVLVQN